MFCFCDRLVCLICFIRRALDFVVSRFSNNGGFAKQLTRDVPAACLWGIFNHKKRTKTSRPSLKVKSLERWAMWPTRGNVPLRQDVLKSSKCSHSRHLCDVYDEIHHHHLHFCLEIWFSHETIEKRILVMKIENMPINCGNGTR